MLKCGGLGSGVSGKTSKKARHPGALLLISYIQLFQVLTNASHLSTYNETSKGRRPQTVKFRNKYRDLPW